MSERNRLAAALRKLQVLFLSIAAVGMLDLGAARTPAIAADISVSETVHRDVPRRHWRVARTRVAYRCIEVSQPPRGCPLWRYSRLPWPGVPRLDESADYPGYGWHRCWWGEWC